MNVMAIAQFSLEFASRYGFYCYFSNKKNLVKVMYF